MLPTEFEETKAPRRPAVEKRHSTRRKTKPDETPASPLPTDTPPSVSPVAVRTPPARSTGSSDTPGASTPPESPKNIEILVKAADVENLIPDAAPKEFELVSHFAFGQHPQQPSQEPSKVKKAILSAEYIAGHPPPDNPANGADNVIVEPEDPEKKEHKSKVKSEKKE